VTGPGFGAFQAPQSFKEFGDVFALGESGQPNQCNFENGGGLRSPGEVLQLSEEGLEHSPKPVGARSLGKRCQRFEIGFAALDQTLGIRRNAEDH
jgi:hypothetical protein